MLILGQKAKKTRVFKKVLILGRKTFQNVFFQKKSKIRIFDFEILFYGEKVTKLIIFYPCFFTKTHLEILQNSNFIESHFERFLTTEL